MLCLYEWIFCCLLDIYFFITLPQTMSETALSCSASCLSLNQVKASSTQEVEMEKYSISWQN